MKNELLVKFKNQNSILPKKKIVQQNKINTYNYYYYQSLTCVMQKKFALNYIFPLYKRLKMKKKNDMNEYKRDLFLQGKNPCIT